MAIVSRTFYTLLIHKGVTMVSQSSDWEITTLDLGSFANLSTVVIEPASAGSPGSN